MKNKLLTLIILSILFFLPVKQAFAAALNFNLSVADGHVGLDQMFKVSVTLDPEGQLVNSLEAQIYYPHDLLKLSAIEDGSSLITMWLVPPREDNGLISLSGMAPRGFSGHITDLDYSKLSPGDVVTLVFEPIKAGLATISASSSRVLLNDGLGTQASLKVGSAVISIGDYEDKFVISSTDTTPPDFIYAEAHYDSALGGQYLFFEASDKDSGIDHYEINEDGVWQTAESPYLIKQNVGVYYIKAIDRAGNETIKEVQISVSTNKYLTVLLWSVVVLIALLVILYSKRLWTKKHKNNVQNY